MFSGIIEATSVIQSAEERADVIQLTVERPQAFQDLHIGDSVAVDGICLTLEAQDELNMQFALGIETVRITGWTPTTVQGRVVNLERSLRLGDRIHGHLVTGHVDCKTRVLRCQDQGENRTMAIHIPEDMAPFIWSKGSVAINGVSLTVNAVAAENFEVGLIPETLKRTNLGLLKVGDSVHLEVDNMARGLVHRSQLMEGGKR